MEVRTQQFFKYININYSFKIKKVIMNDTVLVNVKILVNANLRQFDKNNTTIACSNLLRFAFDKGLLIRSPFSEKGDLSIDTIIRESDLTEKGKVIFDDLADKWFSYTDRTSKFDNISILEKWYNKINKDV
jgi:hypothetical protein